MTHSYGCYRSPFLSLASSLSTHSGDIILLYKNTQAQTKFFRFIFFMSGVQLACWAYLSYFAFGELRQETGHLTPHPSLANKETERYIRWMVYTGVTSNKISSLLQVRWFQGGAVRGTPH